MRLHPTHPKFGSRCPYCLDVLDVSEAVERWDCERVWYYIHKSCLSKKLEANEKRREKQRSMFLEKR